MWLTTTSTQTITCVSNQFKDGSFIHSPFSRFRPTLSFHGWAKSLAYSGFPQGWSPCSKRIQDRLGLWILSLALVLIVDCCHWLSSEVDGHLLANSAKSTSFPMSSNISSVLRAEKSWPKFVPFVPRFAAWVILSSAMHATTKENLSDNIPGLAETWKGTTVKVLESICSLKIFREP